MRRLYTVVNERTLDRLVNEVNKLAADGWLPTGGIATDGDAVGFICYQAMVKGIAATMQVDVVNVITESVTQVSKAVTGKT